MRSILEMLDMETAIPEKKEFQERPRLLLIGSSAVMIPTTAVAGMMAIKT